MRTVSIQVQRIAHWNVLRHPGAVSHHKRTCDRSCWLFGASLWHCVLCTNDCNCFYRACRLLVGGKEVQAAGEGRVHRPPHDRGELLYKLSRILIIRGWGLVHENSF